MMNCRHIIYGNYSRMHWKPLNGLNSVDMELHSIESELDWDDYELWVHGNILEGRDTRDVDLTLIGPYDPEKVQHYLDTIVRIGFESGVYMDVKYLISGEELPDSQLSEFHTGLRFAATKIVQVNRMLAGEHYAEHQGKVFFPSLLEYITGRLHYPGEPWKQRVIAIMYQGKNAIKLIREIAGPTNPHIARDERPGCIRALGTVVPLKDNDGNVIG